MDNKITVCPMCPDCPDNCPVEAEMGVPDRNVGDTIYRQAAIDALWKALHEYEDKTEKQFQESEDLDVGDWIEHRIFVQNMNDIDRQTILNLPSAQPDVTDRNVGDMIFRQDAIDVTWEKMTYTEQWYVLTEVRRRLKALPSAQSEQKSGEWIYDGTKRICPFCKDFIVTGRSIVKYCWNCGARLKERSKDDEAKFK